MMSLVGSAAIELRPRDVRVNAHDVTDRTLVVDGGLSIESAHGPTPPPVAVGKSLGNDRWSPIRGGSHR